MRILSLIILLVFGISEVLAQFGPRIEITSDVTQARHVTASDIDGDGDLDVISGSGNGFGDKIAWYENIDGLGDFGIQQIIATNQDKPQSVFPIDIDGDGDNDILVSYAADKIVWYENVDGTGQNWLENDVTSNLSIPSSAHAVDIDGDNDIDVISSSTHDDKIAWYENLDGLGNFGAQNIISINADFASFVCTGDLDNDGDQDVLSASSHDDKIAWYENTDGLGTFGFQQIINFNANYATSVHTADLDNDGDLDVLSTSSIDNKLAWYENTDGQGNFGLEQIIDPLAYGAWFVYAADLDNDNDYDVLTAARSTSMLVWYENLNGQGQFSTGQLITSEIESPFSVYANDLDGDGDLDVLSADDTDTHISWYENMTILSIPNNNIHDISIFPNPTNGVFNIDGNHSTYELRIYNMIGQEVLTSRNNIEIDITSLTNGLYFAIIIDENKNQVMKKVLKN